MCVGKNTAQAANVRRSKKCCAVRCSGLHLFEKMLAFLREAVDFVDSLRPLGETPRGRCLFLSGKIPLEDGRHFSTAGHSKGIQQVAGLSGQDTLIRSPLHGLSGKCGHLFAVRESI